MKALTFLTIILISASVHAQYNPDAPWMKTLNIAKKTALKQSKTTFKEVVNAFDTYWKNHDPNKKGSGHKPFKRWETYWKNYVKKDGTLPNSSELWTIWEQTQQFNLNSAMADLSNWQPVGPFSHTNTGSWSSGQGRINAIIVDPITPSTYYAGAPAGGIWKSENSGSTWTPLSDNLPQIGVSGIAIDYSDTDIIYIATGDDDNWDTYSIGVMKSEDGGSTWNTTGLNTSMVNRPTNMNDIYLHPTNPQILWVATNKGVFKTIDGGINWDNTNGTENLNIKDIKIKPGDPSTIYAVTTNTLYVSTDEGETFLTSGFGTGLPASSNRLVIDVTLDNPNVLYVLSALNNNFQGIYKSSDSGVNFSEMDANVPATTPDYDDDLFDHSQQAYYDMALAVSDQDEDELYVGVLNIWKSENGGTDFTKVNDWYLPNSPSYSHADIHLLRFYDGILFAGTDGGFYKTTDGGTNFSDLTEGLQIGQFYRLSVSKETSSKMVGGLQDNGGYALNNNNWQVYYGADGMDTAIDPFNSNLMYGFIQYGSDLYISNTSGASSDAYVDIPEGEIDIDNGDNGGNWITPLIMNRYGELYAGYSSLYKLCGTQWNNISTSFGNNVNIDVLEIDNINPDNIYVGINASLRKSEDKGVSYVTVYTFSSTITSIEVNNNDSNLVYITTSGGSGGVFKSIDGGETFSDITGSLPNVTKNIIKHQNLHSQNPLFLGTSLGVYRYDDIIGDWEVFENNLPTVPVRDLEININDSNITAATYGRGIWQSNIPTEVIQNEISLENIIDATALVGCGSISSAKALVKNLGTNTINSVTVSYSLNGISNNMVWTGSIAPNTTTLIEIPTLNFTGEGEQELIINTSVANDTFSGNNELSTIFYSNSLGSINTINEFELPTNNLLSLDDNSICNGYWQSGEPTGTLLNTVNSGNQVYGTNLAGDYENNLKSYLYTNCYNLSVLADPTFKFYMAYDLEDEWDIMYIEYSTDSGLNWNILGTANDPNWYNSNTLPSTNCYNCPGAQWTGTNTNMLEYNYSLASLNNETNIVFRFVFHSDQYTVNEGVIIDDLSIEGTLNVSGFDSQVFRIYPNPSNRIFNIKSTVLSTIDFNITDITGKTVLTKNNIAIGNNYAIDMGAYASGVYFINIISNNAKVTKKLILK